MASGRLLLTHSSLVMSKTGFYTLYLQNKRLGCFVFRRVCLQSVVAEHCYMLFINY
jgi:hypothetical protein